MHMIKVNGFDFPWEEGLTVTKLLKKKGYTFSVNLIVVRINDETISEEEFDTTLINDGDEVQALHIFGGG
ncbi:MAG: sulfur carrier protein ThiS [Bacillota bacterium]|jgi:sulfur carrier protein